MYSTYTMDEWVDTFKPIVNPTNDWGGDYSAFETYGDDFEFVKSQPAEMVWTEIDGDGGSYILNGFHFVNRIQYFVCQVPSALPTYQEVVVCLYKECDCSDEGEGNPDCDECDGDGYMSIYPETREELIEIYGEEVANAKL